MVIGDTKIVQLQLVTMGLPVEMIAETHPTAAASGDYDRSAIVAARRNSVKRWEAGS